MADAGPTPQFTLSLAGEEEAVRDGLIRAMACLSPLKLDADDTSTVELVLAETLNNVIEHALAATSEPTRIEILGTHSPAQGLRLTIIDQGVPMPTGKAPAAKTPDLDVAMDDLPEGGFGWFMIHTLATEVRYTRVGEANHLVLRLPVGMA